MRKLKTKFFAGCLLAGTLLAAACGYIADKEPAPPAPAAPGSTKILIAYFTRADNTQPFDPAAYDLDAASSASLRAPGNVGQLARLIQEQTGGELFSLKVSEPYPAAYEACLERAADEHTRDLLPRLANDVPVEDYDLIFLGFPNWCYSTPNAVLAFAGQHSWQGKTVVPFVAHGSGGLAASVSTVSRLLQGARLGEPFGIEREQMPQARKRIAAWLTRDPARSPG